MVARSFALRDLILTVGVLCITAAFCRITYVYYGGEFRWAMMPDYVIHLTCVPLLALAARNLGRLSPAYFGGIPAWAIEVGREIAAINGFPESLAAQIAISRIEYPLNWLAVVCIFALSWKLFREQLYSDLSLWLALLSQVRGIWVVWVFIEYHGWLGIYLHHFRESP